jgi:hypothetical protein
MPCLKRRKASASSSAIPRFRVGFLLDYAPGTPPSAIPVGIKAGDTWAVLFMWPGPATLLGSSPSFRKDRTSVVLILNSNVVRPAPDVLTGSFLIFGPLPLSGGSRRWRPWDIRLPNCQRASPISPRTAAVPPQSRNAAVPPRGRTGAKPVRG